MANVTTTILSLGADGKYALQNLALVDIARVDVFDVDLVLTDKSGNRYVLPSAAVDAMGSQPFNVVLSGQEIATSDLLKQVGVTVDIAPDKMVPSSQKLEEQKDNQDLEKTKKEKDLLEKKVDELQKEVEAQKKQYEEVSKKQQEKQQEQEARHEKAGSLTTNTEGAVEQLVKEAARIQENLHTKDYDYTPTRLYNPPPSPITAADGVPAPLSMTPFVSITIGNMVGTTTDATTIYGGGGAAGTGADAFLGPRDPLQFSAATIAGTSGADIIYTNGPLTGNADPSADRSYNAKQVILNIAGYFTSLQDIRIEGVPTGVSVQGAADQGNGVWLLPSSYGASSIPFSIIYDMDSWRSGSNTFDVSFRVAGEGAKGQFFDTTQNFRFMYMDVTDVSQSTDSKLIYDYKGQTKQIYVLPTMDQPNIINSGDGDDQIYAGRNVDTITVGDGNNLIYAYQGDDIVTTGIGNNTVYLGTGDNTLTSSTGNDSVYADDGDNIISVGEGTNSVTIGNGTSNITSGSGNDTIVTGSGSVTINAGDGVNTLTTNGALVGIVSGVGDDIISAFGGGGSINAGDGANSITVTTGNFTITSGVGADTVTVGSGDNIINVGDGNNTISAGNGNNILVGGSGNDNFTAGNGNNTFGGGLGANVYVGGTGVNTVNYSAITTTAVTVLLASGTATGTGLADTLTNIQNVVGSAQNDTITGNVSSNTLNGGGGNDILSGGGGNDIFYGEEGNDTITGGTGNDTIYAGNGDNLVYTGTSGADFVYGGVGNNTFVSQHAGVTYNGTNGQNLVSGNYNTVDYSADVAGMTINLLGGYGVGGLANGDVYVATPTSGVISINRIIAGSGHDNITDSNADDYIDGRSGNNVYNINGGNDTVVGGNGTDQFIANGMGNKTYIGNGGVNYYDLGIAAESVVSGGGNDQIRYHRSTAGVLINLDSVAHSVVNSINQTVTVSALSGAGWGATASDANSYAIGDTFSGNSHNLFNGSNANDVVWDQASGSIQFQGNWGVDWYFGGNGGSLIYLSDNDRLDGGGGADTVYANLNNSMFIYLDANVDLNSNGILDYLDRGVSSLTISASNSITGSAITFSGFATGWSGINYLNNIENSIGEGGNDFLVGNAANNLFNGRGGNNTIYGMDGDDTFYSATGGVNSLYGGNGTDTVDFSNGWYGTGTTTVAYVFLGDATFSGGSDKLLYMGSPNLAYQAMTGGGTLAYIYDVENVTGSHLNDVLYGNSSSNTIIGNDGNDILAGNGGTDYLYGNNGNDTFYATSAQLLAAALYDGGAGTDILKVSDLALSAGGITGSKFNSIETLDIRNSASGGSYSMNANDIIGLADNGASSSLTLKLDSGDMFNLTVGAGTGALSYVVASTSATDTIYYLYSDAGHTVANATNRVAILDVYTGTA